MGNAKKKRKIVDDKRQFTNMKKQKSSAKIEKTKANISTKNKIVEKKKTANQNEKPKALNKKTTETNKKSNSVPNSNVLNNGKKSPKAKKPNTTTHNGVADSKKQQDYKTPQSTKSPQRNKKSVAHIPNPPSNKSKIPAPSAKMCKLLIPPAKKSKIEEDSFCYDSEDDSTFSLDTSMESDSDSLDEGSECSDSTSSYTFDSEIISSDDEDYELPEHVPEDLLIHQGTATTRSLLPTDNVYFSDTDEPQIVELEERTRVKTIKQQKSCYSDELLKLNELEYMSKSNLNTCPKNENLLSDAEVCPKLVPITISKDHSQSTFELEDDDGFRPYDEFNTSSLGSSYEECSDDDSIFSLDINSKYVHEYDDSSDNENQKKPSLMKASLVKVTNAVYPECIHISCDETEDLEISPILQPTILNKSSNIRIVTAAVIEEIPAPISANNVVESERKMEEDSPPSTREREREGRHSIFYNAKNSNHVLVLLKDSIYIYGTVRLTLLAGVVQVYGYTPMKNKELEIFSPRGCAAVDITPVATSKKKRVELQQTVKDLSKWFVQTDLKHMEQTFTHGRDALLLLQRNLQCRKQTTFISKHMNENLFPKVNVGNSKLDRPYYSSEYLLNCFINLATERNLQIPYDWLQTHLKAATTKLMIVGGKSVGKSTLLRYIANRYMQQPTDRILLIDLDIGQPELFVPQTISCSVLSGNKPLLGPGIFKNQQPVKAYMLGHTNVLNCAQNYVVALRQLMQFCRNHSEFNNMPWLINTMGYNKGFGLELIAVLIELVQPTNVIQIQSNRDINNFDAILEPHVLPQIPRNIFGDLRTDTDDANDPNYELHVMETAVRQHENRYQREWEMSAKDMRYVIILSRLSDALQGNAEWLTDGKPLVASLDNIKLINTCGTHIATNELPSAIEANLVYLCNYLDDSQPIECLGIGIVRAIDHVTRQIFLMPAMPRELLTTVNCLAIGEIPLPTSLFTNQGPKVSGNTPFVYNTIDGNVSRSIQQIYFRSADFLTGKHKAVLK